MFSLIEIGIFGIGICLGLLTGMNLERIFDWVWRLKWRLRSARLRLFGTSKMEFDVELTKDPEE
jgi:hypothetical protein